jgi:hypothetical protein
MKTKLQKEMRKIRVQLKAHDITADKKLFLRKELEKLRIIQVKSFDKKLDFTE